MNTRRPKNEALEEENESLREQIARLQKERDIERNRRLQLRTTLQGALDRSNDDKSRLKSEIRQALDLSDSPISKIGTAKKEPPLTPKKPIKQSDSPQRLRKLDASTSGPSGAGSKDVKVKPQVKEDPLPEPISVAPLLGNIIGSIPTLGINPPPLSLSIPRVDFGNAYGMGFVPLSFQGKGVGHNRNFIFPGAESNPDLPQGPGEPGLLLGNRPELAKITWSLLLPVSGKPVRYNYFGEYLVVLAGYLAAEEFAQLDTSVKLAWADRLTTTVRHKPYKRLRAQLILRKRFKGKAYTEQQVQDEIKCIVKGYTGGLTIDYALTALEQGLEHINVYKLQCVAYKHDLAREYREAAETGADPASSSFPSKRKRKDDKSDEEDPPSLRASPKQKKRKTASSSVRTAKSNLNGKQRESTPEIDEDSDSNEDDAMSAVSVEPSTPQSSARRSQRSRKPTEKLRVRSQK